jgi:uncharacterized protein (TIGR03435 family)
MSNRDNLDQSLARHANPPAEQVESAVARVWGNLAPEARDTTASTVFGFAEDRPARRLRSTVLIAVAALLLVGVVFAEIVRKTPRGPHAFGEGKVLVPQRDTAILTAGEQVSTASARTVTQVPAVPPPAAPRPPEFEVVAIRPSDVTHTSSMSDAKNERVTIENMNLRQIIRHAYDVEDYQISGPGKLATDRYYIDAKAPAGTPNSGLYPMLQPMLVDRFKMVLKREIRNTPVYALRQTSGGIKVKELAAYEQSSGMGQADPGNGGVVPGIRTSSSTGTMKNLAVSLSRRTDRPVVDRTGLTGRYTIVLQYVPESARQDGVLGPSLDMALEQVGLRLERINAPIEFLEVEQIEKPTPN